MSSVMEIAMKDLGELISLAASKQSEIEALKAETAKKIGWMDKEFSGIRFIAHRGLSQYYPENTLKAYSEASRSGFFGWECDPWITSDGVWVNIHDATVDRTTDGTGAVTSFTLSQIKALNIDGGNNVDIIKGLKVPTIEEIFDLASRMEHKPIIFLNNRTDTPIDAPRTKSFADNIRKYGYEKNSILFCQIESFAGLRKELPSVGLCVDFGSNTPTEIQIDELVTYAPNVMASISYTVLLGASGSNLIQMCKDKGILIQAHTVNDEASINSLRKSGVQSILTDSIVSL